MPQGRGSSKRKSKAKAEPEAPQEQPVDGVLVRNVPAEDGGTTRQIQALGSVSVNELPTLLRLAAKDVERSLGLE
jgi:hypothetical protein